MAAAEGENAATGSPTISLPLVASVSVEEQVRVENNVGLDNFVARLLSKTIFKNGLDS